MADGWYRPLPTGIFGMTHGGQVWLKVQQGRVCASTRAGGRGVGVGEGQHDIEVCSAGTGIEAILEVFRGYFVYYRT